MSARWDALKAFVEGRRAIGEAATTVAAEAELVAKEMEAWEDHCDACGAFDPSHVCQCENDE